ncbi:MAG TPA: FtsW/RodA/SpoVE family cell cycle protein [Pirellulales bacterium]|jgi:cell division protein FtsW (lipid II flippase)|nr:FtsW/RodA/SpoVE family cell cycle protein [Pirellulales bacterium]
MQTWLVARRYPWLILTVAIVLLFLGWKVLARCEQINDGANRLVPQQVVWSILGLGLLVLTSLLDYRHFARYSSKMYWVTVGCLVAVYFFPTINGAHRWIRAGGLGLQPSEFAKVILVISLARLLMHQDLPAGFVHTMLRPLGMTALPMLLVLKEPDLGTSLVFLPVLFAILFVAGARRRDMFRLAVAAVLLLPLLWAQISHDQRSRVIALWEQNPPREPATSDGFHLDQAKRMLSLGEVWGSIFSPVLDDDAIAARLPEAQTDSIFCVLTERFGIAGSGFVLLLFASLAAKCLHVAGQTDERFGRLLTVGVAALFASEVCINAGMMVGLLPVTGLALPLFSYGGSDLIAHLWALGLVASVARRRDALM